jgi:hypothetical protein
MDTGGSSQGIKRPGCEADHSAPTNAVVNKNVDLYTHAPIRLRVVVLN